MVGGISRKLTRMPEYDEYSRARSGYLDDYVGVDEDVAEEAKRTRQELERRYGLSVDPDAEFFAAHSGNDFED